MDKEQTANIKTTKKLTVGYFDIIVIALLAAVLTVTAYDHFFVEKVMVVDLTGYVKQQRELFAEGKIREAEVSANLKGVQQFIANQPKNTTVIIKDVVLAGGKELSLPAGGNRVPEKDTKK